MAKKDMTWCQNCLGPEKLLQSSGPSPKLFGADSKNLAQVYPDKTPSTIRIRQEPRSLNLVKQGDHTGTKSRGQIRLGEGDNVKRSWSGSRICQATLSRNCTGGRRIRVAEGSARRPSEIWPSNKSLGAQKSWQRNT